MNTFEIVREMIEAEILACYHWDIASALHYDLIDTGKPGFSDHITLDLLSREQADWRTAYKIAEDWHENKGKDYHAKCKLPKNIDLVDVFQDEIDKYQMVECRLKGEHPNGKPEVTDDMVNLLIAKCPELTR